VPDLAHWLARLRVPLGFVSFAIVIGLARPTWPLLAVGTGLALVGEAIRIWAAGHLEKGREVTKSGPYRFLAHPLYAGSALMAGGLALAAASFWSALLIGTYLGLTVTAAIRSEEAALRDRFGTEYDGYLRGQEGSAEPSRRFSLARAWRNREYRAVAGVVGVVLLLALKATWAN
jgi:protein-S-isoprenylcysteine O-methyltransferase Ste14